MVGFGAELPFDQSVSEIRYTWTCQLTEGVITQISFTGASQSRDIYLRSHLSQGSGQSLSSIIIETTLG